MAYTATNTALHASPINAGARALRALAARHRAWRSYRVTVKALAGLSDRELDDIGLTRSEIKYVARSTR